MAQNDVIDALAGDDTITIQQPSTTLPEPVQIIVHGGEGFDTMGATTYYLYNFDFTGFAGTLRLRAESGPEYIVNFDSIEWLTFGGRLTLAAPGVLRTGDTRDHVSLSEAVHPVVYYSGGGDDIVSINGSVPAVTVDLGAGDDTLYLDLALFPETAPAPIANGGDGADYIVGSTIGARLYGDGGNDRLFAYFGDDLIDGGAGADQMYGAGGNDIYFVDDQGDLAIEFDEPGTDTVVASFDFVLGQHLENLILAPGSAAIVGTGNAGNNVITGNGSANRLEGAGGDDILRGGEDDSDDMLDGGAGSDVAEFFVAPGRPGVLEIIPASSGDVRDFDVRLVHVDGGSTSYFNVFQVRFSGAAATVAPLDTFHNPTSFDTVTGVETLRFALPGDPGSAIETLTLLPIAGGPTADILAGTGGRDSIAGLGGDDRLEGGAGNDTLHGGDGDDVLISGSGIDGLSGGAGDDILYFGPDYWVFDDLIGGGEGEDRVVLQGYYHTGIGLERFVNVERLVLLPAQDTTYGGPTQYGSYGLVWDGALAEGAVLTIDGTALDDYWDFNGSGENAGRFVLLGGSAGDDLEAGAGADVIDGGGGADLMTGNLGDDLYYADMAYDEVVEGVDGGFDTVVSSSDFFLDFNVEKLILVGAATYGGGNGGANILIGNAGDNGLTGLAGDDLLDGGAGADAMAGGADNDIYIVDHGGDSVVENAGQGTDEIRTALATYSLAALVNVENLTAASDASHDFRGNSGNNVITGGGGRDLLRLYDGGTDTVLAGAGDDNIFFIGALTSADVIDGGAGVDTLVVQGPYGSLALTANITQIENVSILGGNNINFGEPGTNRYDYVLTIHDSNFAAGVQARINGAALLEGEDFTFDGSAETDAKFVVYGGKGKDTLTGGLGNDIFFYAEERFASGDTVNGGAGYDGMFLRGNYTIDFNAPGYTGLFTNIENLTLTSATDERYARGGGSEFDYNLTLSDAIVGAGQELTVSGALLLPSETMVLDASQETNGRVRLFGGAAADTLKGGALADLFHGSFGADTLSGGGGADVFRYQSETESYSVATDHIIDFTPGIDKIELDRIDARTEFAGDQAFTWIGSNAFSGVSGQLRAAQSGGQWIVEGDINGDGFADLIIALTLQGPTPLGAGDFVL